MTDTVRLYRLPLSGHCHRVELLLSMLELPHQLIDVTFGALPLKVPRANSLAQSRAPQGRISLARYPHVRAWLRRIEALAGFVPMAQSPSEAP